MSIVRYKVLVATDFCNKIIQARDGTLDVQLFNVLSLLFSFQRFEVNAMPCEMKQT